MNTDSQWFVLHVRLRCGSLSITTPVSLGNEFNVRSVLHRQVSLAAVNQICVIHEALNGYKILKITGKGMKDDTNDQARFL